jgi:hypothetical protein
MPALLRSFTAAILLVPGALAPAGTAFAGEVVARPCGDANHDFVTNSIDALVVLQVDAGLLPAPPVSYDTDADWLFFNADLVDPINSLDALVILQFDAGHIPELRDCYEFAYPASA